MLISYRDLRFFLSFFYPILFYLLFVIHISIFRAAPEHRFAAEQPSEVNRNPVQPMENEDLFSVKLSNSYLNILRLHRLPMRMSGEIQGLFGDLNTHFFKSFPEFSRCLIANPLSSCLLDNSVHRSQLQVLLGQMNHPFPTSKEGAFKSFHLSEQ